MKKKSERREADFYPTPDYTTMSLINSGILRDIDMSRVLEPCAGSGDICQIFDAPFNHVHSIELRPEEKENLEDVSNSVQIGDFLTMDVDFEPTFIVTNPPFNLAKEFIDKCLTFGCPVAMLLRLGFLSSNKRHDWWQDKIPSDLLVLSKRPSFTDDGKTDGQDYAWFIWNGKGEGLKVI